MLRAYKTEINPTEEQKILINKTIGTCRYVYNFYIAHNKEVYDGIDHIKPLSKHPELLNNIDNLQYIHRKINFFKQDFEEKEFLDFVRDIKNNLNL